MSTDVVRSPKRSNPESSSFPSTFFKKTVIVEIQISHKETKLHILYVYVDKILKFTL